MGGWNGPVAFHSPWPRRRNKVKEVVSLSKYKSGYVAVTLCGASKIATITILYMSMFCPGIMSGS